MVQLMGLPCICVLFLAMFIQNGEAHTDKTKIIMLTTMFRHGDRSPDPIELLSSSEYGFTRKNNTYLPVGLGQLTNQGKLRLYNNGVMMRDMYGHFLGDILEDGVVIPYVTSYPRTGTSVLAFLAGLFPPVQSQQWDFVSNSRHCANLQECQLSEPSLLPKLWNPIPYIYDLERDKLMRSYTECSAYYTELARVISTPKIQEKIKSYDEMLQFVSKSTGKENIEIENLLALYGLLTSEENLGIPKPSWSHQVWGQMEEALDFFYDVLFHSNEAKRLSGGAIARRILDDMQAKCNETLVPKNRKIIIYSGHDMTVVPLLASLGGGKGYLDEKGNPVDLGFPNFGATVIIELHRNLHSGKHFVKILYHNFKSSEPQPLKIVGCDLMCPIDKLIELTENTTMSQEELDKMCPEFGVFSKLRKVLTS